MSAVSAAEGAGLAGPDAASGKGFACATSVAGTLSTFSTSKETIFCGLLSSRMVKFSGFNPGTNFPLLPLTVTFTSTRSDSARNTAPVWSCEGKAVDKRTSSRRSAADCLAYRFLANRFGVKVIALLFESVLLGNPAAPSSSETKARRNRKLPHRPRRRNPAEGERVEVRINRGIVH